jgi:hypothetical protein
MKQRPILWGVMEGKRLGLVFDTKKEATQYKRDSRDEGKVVPLYTKPPEVK